MKFRFFAALLLAAAIGALYVVFAAPAEGIPHPPSTGNDSGYGISVP